MVVHYDAYPDEAVRFIRILTEDSTTLLYAFTQNDSPALIIKLLNSGFNDVFIPPFNYDLISARIKKSLVLVDQKGGRAVGEQSFSGTFRDLPFVDLIQALAVSRRNVKIEMQGGPGQRATIYLREGQMVHAGCGEDSGEEAVYAIVRWRERGSFDMTSTDDHPPDNISKPNDFLLMEGLRRLDEESLKA